MKSMQTYSLLHVSIADVNLSCSRHENAKYAASWLIEFGSTLGINRTKNVYL
jgi:hypothetical protein